MKLTVRELTNPDIDLVLSYFFKADAETLNLIGVDSGKLPQKARLGGVKNKNTL